MAGASGLNKAQKATEVLSGMSAESLVAVSKEMGHEMTMGQARMMAKFVSFIGFVPCSCAEREERASSFCQ